MTVLGNVARWLLMLALVLGGCSARPTEDGSAQSIEQEPSRTTELFEPATAEATPKATAGVLDAMLPVELGGVELHTFAVGQDTLERLAGHLGIGADELAARYASEHGVRFLQMYAVRAPQISGPDLVEGWAAVAYPDDIIDASSSDQTVADKAVIVLHSPSAAGRLGTYYVYSVADTLVVVQAFDPVVAAEALAALP